MARALEASSALIRACANGLRTTVIHSIPGTVRSSVYSACPVRNSGSSLRRTGVPTYFSVVAIVDPPSGPRAAPVLRGVGGRLHDVLGAGAAAQVALEGRPHLLLGRVRVLPEERVRGHDHPRRAVPALQAVVAMEGLLQRMHLPVGGHGLDRRHLAPIGLGR